MNLLLQNEIEEQDAILAMVAEEAQQAQINSDTELTRIFDAIHDQGGEVYAVLTDNGFYSDSTGMTGGCSRDTLLEAVLHGSTVIIHLHTPDHTDMTSPTITINKGVVTGYYPNSPWLRGILFTD